MNVPALIGMILNIEQWPFLFESLNVEFFKCILTYDIHCILEFMASTTNASADTISSYGKHSLTASIAYR